MKMEKEYDSNPAFHKLGFNDEEDAWLKEASKKYMERYRLLEAREKMGTDKDIHTLPDENSLRSI